MRERRAENANARHDRGFDPNVGLAVAAALVLAIMAAVIGATITALEAGGHETEVRTSMPAMWQEPSARVRGPVSLHS